MVAPDAQAEPAEIAYPSLSRLIINDGDFVLFKVKFIIPGALFSPFIV